MKEPSKMVTFDLVDAEEKAVDASVYFTKKETRIGAKNFKKK